MIALLRILLTPFILVSSLFLGVFGTIYIDYDKYIEKNFQLSYAPIFNSKVTFQEISPYITFTSIGIKLSGVKEEVEGQEILHQNPLYISFNPWTFKFIAEYKGISNITSSPNNIDSLTIDSDIKLIFNMNYDFDVLVFMMKNRPAKLINFIKTTTIEYDHLDIINNKTNTNIFEAKNSKLMLLLKHKYYSTINDIINNPPKYYSISGIANIVKSVNQKNLVPASIIYGIIPNFDLVGPFFIEIDSHAKKFDLHLPFENAKTRIICNNCKSSMLDLDLKSEFDSKEQDLKIDLLANFSFKKPFFDNIPVRFKKIINLIKKYDTQAAAFLSSPEKSFPPINYDSNFTISTKSNFNITDNAISTNINNLIIRSSTGSGIMINGKANLKSDFTYNLDIGLVLSNAENFMNYWGDYIYKIIQSPQDVGRDILEFNKRVNFKTAKNISEYPTSKSNDLMFTIQMNSKLNALLISKKNISDLLFSYYKIKSQILLENAEKSQNPLKYIKKVTPELAPLAEDLLKELPKNTKVNKELWQKLIK